MIISKPCTTMRGVVVGAYSWDHPLRLDLRKTAECLRDSGFDVIRIIPNMVLIVKVNGYETSIYPTGKIIIKLLDDADEGRKIAEVIYRCAGVWEFIREG